tara:strand:+ start:10680 stop:11084 length:405 start_codon:yes stop_codon:yes gene_type:complete
MKKLLFTLLFLLLFSFVSAQTTPNFFLNNVHAIVHNYSTAHIANNTNDNTIKHSFVVTATGGNISATFIMYFGENIKEANVQTTSTNVHTVRSWHKLEEYDTLSNLLNDKTKIGIGYFNKFGFFPNRVQISKSN